MQESSESEHDSEGLPQYEVQAILKMRQLHNGLTQYFVKWKRFPTKYNTWENEDNLNCPELIKKFLAGEEEEEYEEVSSSDESNSTKKSKKESRSSYISIPIREPSRKMGPKLFYQQEKDKSRPFAKITDAYKNNGKCYFILTMPDGFLKEVTSTIAKSKYPIQLIDFLESKILIEDHQ